MNFHTVCISSALSTMCSFFLFGFYFLLHFFCILSYIIFSFNRLHDDQFDQSRSIRYFLQLFYKSLKHKSIKTDLFFNHFFFQDILWPLCSFQKLIHASTGSMIQISPSVVL